MQKVLWSVSLSNGETLYENKGNFKNIKDELSPWQRLLLYLAKEKVEITSMSLYCGDKRWHLPSAGKSPKFQAFSQCEKPYHFKFFRKMGANMNKDTGEQTDEEHFAVVEAFFEGGTSMQVWVDEEKQNSWTILNNESK